MRKFALPFLFLPFVAVWVFGCDQTETPLEPRGAQAATVEANPSFAAGGNAFKTGIVGVQVVTDAQAPGAYTTYTRSAECPAGKWPIAGGYSISTSANQYELRANLPENVGTDHGKWTVGLTRTGGSTDWTVFVSALCVDAVSVGP